MPRQRKMDAPNGAPESRADRFRRKCNARLPFVLRQLELLAKLGNRSFYEYTPEQRDTVLRVINGAVKDVLDAFSDKQAPASKETVYV